MKHIHATLLIGVLLVLAAGCAAVTNPHRPTAPDQTWTAASKMRATEAERPRGAIEQWELKRPSEFNRVEAQ